MPENSSRGRGRPRDTRIDEAILATASALLAERGFARLTMDQVAARSGVGKASLYLRWPNKTALIADAIRHQADQVRDIPDTGTLAGDMRAFIHGLLRGKPLAEQVLASVQGEIHSSPELRAALRENAVGAMSARCSQVLDRAVARGELPASADLDLLAMLPLALLQNWTLTHGKPPDDTVVERIVAQFYTPLYTPREDG